MGALAKLKKFAKAREKAYGMTGYLNGARAKAISKILLKADFFSQKSETVQLNAVLQLESEIILLLPHEESRFSKLRADMLELINTAKTKYHEKVSASGGNQHSLFQATAR
ncbi:hypothetical protein [Mongoliibacter ruber]|uniref:Four helix bundle protein n=1 Tax=Mongoliibacter ruber TaxID=1750599 RepID=A0A2T0WVL0_9BACT|nr:hypothetical protein [Mongoliibacter ruber]PRY90624.1 hypothetical protein CLW00_101288 [Mongoliibacter ruber]